MFGCWKPCLSPHRLKTYKDSLVWPAVLLPEDYTKFYTDGKSALHCDQHHKFRVRHNDRIYWVLQSKSAKEPVLYQNLETSLQTDAIKTRIEGTISLNREKTRPDRRLR